MLVVMKPACFIIRKSQIKSALCLFLVGLLSPTDARSQDASGSIVVIGVSEEKVIVAADSRAKPEDGGYVDSYCKITALSDKLIFSVTGFARVHSDAIPEDLRFDSIEVARKAFAQFTSNSELWWEDDTTVQRIASIWANAMNVHFIKAAPFQLQHWLSRMAKRRAVFVRGIIAGLDQNGKIVVSVGIVQYWKQQPGTRMQPPARTIVETLFATDKLVINAFGRTEIVREILDGSTERARIEGEQMNFLQSSLPPEQFDSMKMGSWI